jgi:hypothetical protein
VAATTDQTLTVATDTSVPDESREAPARDAADVRVAAIASTAASAAVATGAPETAASSTARTALGEPRQFRLSFAVPGGGRTLTFAEIWFSDGSTRQHDDHACVVYVERRSGTAYLVNDEGSALLSAAIGSPGELANSQCALDLRSIEQTGEPNALNLALGIRLNADIERRLVVLTQTVDDAGISSGWLHLPDETVAPH